MESNLTEFAKREISLYVDKEVSRILIKKLIPTGAIASVIGILIGFMINESARSIAYEKAFDLFSEKVTQASYDVGKSKQDAEYSLEKVREIEKEMSQLLLVLRMKQKELEAILNKSATANQIAKALGTNEFFKKELLSQLQKETKSINRRIDGIKLVEGTKRQTNFGCGGQSIATEELMIMYGSRDGTGCGVQNTNYFKEIKISVPN